MSHRNKFGSLEQPCSKTHWRKNSNEYIEHYASKQSIYVHASPLQSERPVEWFLETQLDNNKAERLSKRHAGRVTFYSAIPDHLSFDICADIVIVENSGAMDLHWFSPPGLIINISMAFLRWPVIGWLTTAYQKHSESLYSCESWVTLSKTLESPTQHNINT